MSKILKNVFLFFFIFFIGGQELVFSKNKIRGIQQTLAPLSVNLNDSRGKAVSFVADFSPQELETIRKSDPEFAQKTWFFLYTRAILALEMKDEASFEKLNNQALYSDVPLYVRNLLLLRAGKYYFNKEQLSKAAAIYEKWLSLFTKDALRPKVLLRTGSIYKKMGLFDLALNRFYQVINFALQIHESEIKAFQKVLDKAQLAIGDIYFVQNKIDQAIPVYARIIQQNGTSETLRIIARFKLAYSCYKAKDKSALELLKQFILDFPQNTFVPEAYYYLASIYLEKGFQVEALKQLSCLLSLSSIESDTVTAYWQYRAANTIANQLYLDREFLKALSVYRKLLALQKDPMGRWPTLYAIGLCLMQLKEFEAAKKIYQLLQSEKTPTSDQNLFLKTLQQLTEERLLQIENQATLLMGVIPLLSELKPK